MNSLTHLYVSKTEPWNTGLSFFLMRRQSLANAHEIAKITFEKHPENIYSDPSFILEMETAQALMDNLWDVGLRPTQGAGSAGSLAAMERHLAHVMRILDIFLQNKAV